MKNAFFDNQAGVYKDENGNSFPLLIWQLTNKALIPKMSKETKGSYEFFTPSDSEYVIEPNQVKIIEFDIAMKLPVGIMGYFMIGDHFLGELVIQNPLCSQSIDLQVIIGNMSRHNVYIGKGEHVFTMMLFQTTLSMEVVVVR